MVNLVTKDFKIENCCFSTSAQDLLYTVYSLVIHSGTFSLQGDSGGPIVCRNRGGRWELIGIVSFGLFSCQFDIVPSVFTSVPPYVEWIESQTG